MSSRHRILTTSLPVTCWSAFRVGVQGCLIPLSTAGHYFCLHRAGSVFRVFCFLQAKKYPQEGGISIGIIRLRQHRELLSKTWGNYIYSGRIGAWLRASIAWPGATIDKGFTPTDYAMPNSPKSDALVHRIPIPNTPIRGVPGQGDSSISAMRMARRVISNSMKNREKWWACTDLNCGPFDYESNALTN